MLKVIIGDLFLYMEQSFSSTLFLRNHECEVLGTASQSNCNKTSVLYCINVEREHM